MAPAGKITRPLLSIGEECDKGNIVVFSKTGGAIIAENTGALRKFPRLQSGAYEIEMWIPPVDLIEARLTAGGHRAWHLAERNQRLTSSQCSMDSNGGVQSCVGYPSSDDEFGHWTRSGVVLGDDASKTAIHYH